jgi:hypothetical protein
MGLGSFVVMTGLVLNPFGPFGPFGMTPDLLQMGKPWYAFEDHGPVLQLVRVQKMPVKSCKAWTDALVTPPAADSKNGLVPVRLSDNVDTLRRDWEPWTEKDLEPIKECDDFPCKVKFDATEVDAMKNTSPADRVSKFHSLVIARVTRYVKTQVRKAYEIPGDPVDPWKLFEEKGFKPNVARPQTPTLYARKLNFAPDKMLTIHQVLDRRAAEGTIGPATTEAVVWVRDAYTDHYFDSWGEWSSVHCDANLKEVVIIQSLLSEMDLLKSKSLFAHAVFGKYRSAYEDNGKIYLDEEFERLKKTALKAEAETAQPSAVPSKKPKNAAR